MNQMQQATSDLDGDVPWTCPCGEPDLIACGQRAATNGVGKCDPPSPENGKSEQLTVASSPDAQGFVFDSEGNVEGRVMTYTSPNALDKEVEYLRKRLRTLRDIAGITHHDLHEHAPDRALRYLSHALAKFDAE